MQHQFYSPCTVASTLLSQNNLIRENQISRQILLLAAINQQFLLTQHLIQSQFRLTEEMKKERQSSDSGQSSLPNNQNNTKKNSIEDEEDFKFASQNLNDSSSAKSQKEQEPLTRLRIKKVFKYDIDSDSQNSKKETKRCETKNIIKNFIKSIFNFVRKHKNYINKLLKQHNIEQQHFMQNLQKLNGKVNTILQLRQLWTQSPYNQIYRTISSYFLRRYSLKHIFHSRISNYQIHLKYRCKLLESLCRPEQFNSLKDF